MVLFVCLFFFLVFFCFRIGVSVRMYARTTAVGVCQCKNNENRYMNSTISFFFVWVCTHVKLIVTYLVLRKEIRVEIASSSNNRIVDDVIVSSVVGLLLPFDR